MNNPAVLENRIEFLPNFRGLSLAAFIAGVMLFVFLLLGFYVHYLLFFAAMAILVPLLYINKVFVLYLYVLSYAYTLPLFSIRADIRFDDLLFAVIASIWFMDKALNPSVSSKYRFLSSALIFWLIVNAFSIIANIGGFDSNQIIYSGYYFIRLVEYVLVYFIVTDMIKSPQMKVALIRIIFVITVYICLYGIYQYHIEGLSRVTATLAENHAHIGSFLVFNFFVLAGYALQTKNAIEKFLITLFLPVMVYVLFLSALRAGIIALLCGTAVYFIFRQNLASRFIAVLVILVTVYFGIDFLQNLQDYELGNAQFANLEQDLSLFGRFYIWTETVKMIGNNPSVLVTGIGLGAYQYVMNPLTPFFDGVNGGHNNYLHILTENGIAGLVIFMYILISLLRNSFRKAREYGKRKGALYYGYFCGLAALMVTAITQETFSVQVALHNILGYFFLITAVVFYEPEKKNTEKMTDSLENE